MSKEPKGLDLAELSDEERVRVIADRYYGRMHTLDFTDRDTRDQLALDLGMLIGMVIRLLHAAPPSYPPRRAVEQHVTK